MKISYRILKIVAGVLGFLSLISYTCAIFILWLIFDIFDNTSTLYVNAIEIFIVLCLIGYVIALFKEVWGATVMLILILIETMILSLATIEPSWLIVLVVLNIPLLITVLLFFVVGSIKSQSENKKDYDFCCYL